MSLLSFAILQVTRIEKPYKSSSTLHHRRFFRDQLGSFRSARRTSSDRTNGDQTIPRDHFGKDKTIGPKRSVFKTIGSNEEDRLFPILDLVCCPLFVHFGSSQRPDVFPIHPCLSASSAHASRPRNEDGRRSSPIRSQPPKASGLEGSLRWIRCTAKTKGFGFGVIAAFFG